MIDYSFSLYDLEYFLLIFTRISCFVFIAPFFGMANTPRRIKVVLSLYVATLMYFVLTPAPAVLPKTVLGFAIIVTKEAVTGLLIGLSAQMCTSIVMFGGAVADMEIGLSMVQLFDPLTREGTGFMGSLYQYILVLIMLITNMHYYFLRAIVETFSIIPIGGAHFSSTKIMTTMITFMTDFITISFRLCLPVVAAMLLLNAILGVLAKTAPQINMFSVGIQIKIVVGLGILFLTIGTIPSASEFIFKEMRIMVTAMVESMK